MIQYDENMFSQLYSSKNKIKKYKHLIAELKNEKTKNDQTLLNMKKKLTNIKMNLKKNRNVNDNLRKINAKMLQRINKLQRQNREITQSISSSFVAEQLNYRSREINLAKSFTKKFLETYNF